MVKSHCDDFARAPVTLFAQPRIAVGMKQLAFFIVCSALEDGQGRKLHTKTDEEKRKVCADGIRWLRDRKSDRVFSLNWCSNLLNVPAEYLANCGISRIGGGGLLNWRRWRRDRDHNRIKRLPILLKVCPGCGVKFRTKSKMKQHCSQPCAVAHQALQPRRALIVHCVCLHCHQTFTARDAGRTFCSAACTHNYQRSQRHDAYRAHREREEQAVYV
jgi:hypothetical protein